MAGSPRSERLARMAPASMTEKPAATVVFFSRAIRTLNSGGITARTAWGRTTRLRVCPKSRPMARAASAWPIGTVLIPDRIVSAM